MHLVSFVRTTALSQISHIPVTLQITRFTVIVLHMQLTSPIIFRALRLIALTNRVVRKKLINAMTKM